MHRDTVEQVERGRFREESDDAGDVADGPTEEGFEFDQPLVGDDEDDGDDGDEPVGGDAGETVGGDEPVGGDAGETVGDDGDGTVGDDAGETDGAERDRTAGQSGDRSGGRPERDRVQADEGTADGAAGFRPLDPYEGATAGDVTRSAGDDAFEEDLGAVVRDLASVLDRTTGVVAAVARGLERGELVVAETGGGGDRTAREVARAAVAEVAALLVLRRRLTAMEDAVAGLGGGGAVADPPADVRAALRAATVPAGDGSRSDPGARADALAVEVEEAADEANLLAFNAAVDATDGDGRADAFARVADEVQSVAERSRAEVSEVATLTAPVRATGGGNSVTDGTSGADDAPNAASGPHAGGAKHSEDADGPT
ncbi:MAG: hypothetical protein ABEJ22_05975 [Haloferacaceae archaeon]